MISRAILAAALGLALVGGVAVPEQAAATRLPERRILLAAPNVGPRGRELARPFADALISSFTSAAETRGFAIVRFERPAAEVEEIESARDFGEDWLARVSVSVQDERLSYRLEIVSVWSGEMVAADSFAAYAGPTAFPLIDDSAARVAERLDSYVSAPGSGPRRPVSYRITLLSRDEGARVTLGPPDSKLSPVAGTVQEGKLVLPYYPFDRGSTIRLYVSALGFKTEVLRVYLGEAPPTVLAPRLERQSYQDLIVGTGSGRLLGIQVGYRRYVVPQWAFLFIDDRLFAGYDFLPGSSPFLHEELWTGFGSYLILPPESPFRFGAELGLGYLFSYSTVPGAQRRLYFDFALLPVYVFFEHTVSHNASVWLSVSSAFSLGTGSAGILGREWIGNGPPSLGAGVVWRL